MENDNQGQDLISLKLQYGEHTYITNFGDIKIPFRILTYKEYKAYNNLINSDEFENNDIYIDIYSRCCLDEYYRDKEDPPDIKAGIPVTVGQLILRLSYPHTEDEFHYVIDNIYRPGAKLLEEQMKLVICASFPGYTLEKIDDLPYDTILRLFTGAEAMLVERGADPFPIGQSSSRGMKNGTISSKDIMNHNNATGR